MDGANSTDPVIELLDTLKAVRRDVDRLGQDMQGTLKAAQAAEMAAAKPRTLTLDVSALGPAFGTLSDRVASLDTTVSALGADRLRSEVVAALHDARGEIDAATHGVRQATARLTLRLTAVLSLVVLGATGAQFAGVAASTFWGQAERARLAAEVERLRVALPTLQARAEDWQRRAGRVVLTNCQSDDRRTRLCVRIDLSAPRFGPRGEYAVLDGY
ncbi:MULTISPECIES: hypothetical protein [unclassified Bradyrhizobium]|nr:MULTISPECIES: hypothetical protein [unclassified Bradyrhizobium]MCK1628450.1 hypothetical protein [Bradyrhizobium sp. 160]MCK1287130.1 hypothetical protein [Bradyrhizobium sp. 44]MCK1291876.1 hypothetical protein [Bradyrhizobium sp. 30]MCK1306659.1 hypothetical protein [Bradyrhizobium sp. 45]MCK1372110.1 hypothetical protein [Bradyrhizobium sp. 49]